MEYNLHTHPHIEKGLNNKNKRQKKTREKEAKIQQLVGN